MVYIAGLLTALVYAANIPMKFALKFRLENWAAAIGVSVFENRFALRAAKPHTHGRKSVPHMRIRIKPLLRGIRLDIRGKIALDSAMHTALVCGSCTALCTAIGEGLGMDVHMNLTPDFQSDGICGEIRCIATATTGHIILAVCLGILQTIGQDWRKNAWTHIPLKPS